MVDPIRPRGKKAGEISHDRVVGVKLELLAIKPCVLADRTRDQKVPSDIVPIWNLHSEI